MADTGITPESVPRLRARAKERKAKGKENGKGDAGKGKGSKGKGKGGFGGECWVCGEKGHRSYECPGSKKEGTAEIGSVEEADDTKITAVWTIAQVTAEFEEAGWTVKRPSRNCKSKNMTENKGTIDKLLKDFQKTCKHAEGDGRENAKMQHLPEVSINMVSKKAEWKAVGSGEITIDSAAEESVCPKNWGEAYELKRPENG